MRKVRTSGIYVIRNSLNGKQYVGSSTHIERRWVDHRKALRNDCHCNPHLQNAWNKHGEGVFSFAVLQVEENPQKLGALEQQCIRQMGVLDRGKGYNANEPNGVGGYRMSPETKAKIGAANRGKVRTPDMRAHMSEVKKGQGKGRVKSLAEIENMRASHRKHPRRHSPETRKKISKARKGVPWTQARWDAQKSKQDQ